MRIAIAALLISACGSTQAPAKAPVDPAPRPEPAAMKPEPSTPTHPWPATRKADVVDTIHGVAIHDPYRWLEDEKAPEVQAWMKAQDDYTRGELAKLPERDALAARLKELFYYDAVGAPIHYN